MMYMFHTIIYSAGDGFELYPAIENLVPRR